MKDYDRKHKIEWDKMIVLSKADRERYLKKAEFRSCVWITMMFVMIVIEVALYTTGQGMFLWICWGGAIIFVIRFMFHCFHNSLLIGNVNREISEKEEEVIYHVE